MIKAYIKNGVITLKENGQERAVFLAGSALTTIEDIKGARHPYSLFPDYEKSVFQAFALETLDKLSKMKITSPERLIAEIDQGNSKKLFEGNPWNMTFETQNGEAVCVFFLSSAKDLFALEMLCVIQSKNL